MQVWYVCPGTHVSVHVIDVMCIVTFCVSCILCVLCMYVATCMYGCPRYACMLSLDVCYSCMICMYLVHVHPGRRRRACSRVETWRTHTRFYIHNFLDMHRCMTHMDDMLGMQTRHLCITCLATMCINTVVPYIHA